MTDKFRGIDDDPGWINRRLDDLQKQINQRAPEKRYNPVSLADSRDVGGLTLPASAPASYAVADVQVPANYNRALVNMQSGANVTVASSSTTANGRLRVRPVIGGVLGPELETEEPGTGILSVTSPFATKLVVTPGGSFQLWATAWCSGTGTTAGSGRVVWSATVIFTRE